MSLSDSTKEPVCYDCGELAVWEKLSKNQFACDEHVPRGCSCTFEPIDGDYQNQNPENWAPEIGKDGRKVPCGEWDYVQGDVTPPYRPWRGAGVQGADLRNEKTPL